MTDWDELSPLEIDNQRLRAEITRLRDENARLRAALKPFVPKTQVIDPAIPDTRPIDVMVRAGDLRAARAVIGGTDIGDGDEN